MKSSQVEQRKRITGKYAGANECRFWKQFAKRGLTELEELAIQATLSEGDRILDVGCGCGREAVELQRRGMEVCPLDVVYVFAKTTQERMQELGLPARAVCADVTDGVPFSGLFDAAVLFEQIYQHIPERKERLMCLQNIRTALKSKGLLLLSAFNEGDIDLWSRILWMRDTNWEIVTAAVRGRNLLDARYEEVEADPVHGSSIRKLSWRKALWTLAYLRFLIRRKWRTVRLRRAADRNEYDFCKPVQRTNPLTESDGWFWLRVMSLMELSKELQEAGFKIERVYPLLGHRYECSRRSSWGAPAVVLAARATGEAANE